MATPANDFFNKLEGVWQNKLDGNWQDDLGWNFISQPRLDVPGGGDFDMRFDQMRETITFEKLDGMARNVGITGEAGFWQAMKYEIAITDPEANGIHHEMGHLLLSVKEDGDTKESLKGPVIRQASIPRANSMMTNGTLEIASVADAIRSGAGKVYDAKPRSDDAQMQSGIDAEISSIQNDITTMNGPDLQDPLPWLETKLGLPKTGGTFDWVFEFRNDKNPSQMANGQRVVNPVSVGNLLSDFWIGDRDRNGATIEVLQYAQKVDLVFHGIGWPHTAVNTLIKQ